MESDTQAASERILLEPYKYLLQLPGESLSMSVTANWIEDVQTWILKVIKKLCVLLMSPRATEPWSANFLLVTWS